MLMQLFDYYPLCVKWLFAKTQKEMWLLASDWLATTELCC